MRLSLVFSRGEEFKKRLIIQKEKRVDDLRSMKIDLNILRSISNFERTEIFKKKKKNNGQRSVEEKRIR